MTTPILDISHVCRSYGSIKAVDDVTFAIATGARHALIGPNGAGKSSLFQLITGGLRVTSGGLSFASNDVTNLTQVHRSRLGIAQTFQHSSLFMAMSAVENVSLAAQQVVGGTHHLWRAARRTRVTIERAHESLAAVGLFDRRSTLARELSHGERQQLEVAIALATQPRLILFDEPTAGMSASETARFAEIVGGLDPQISVLIIEHDLDLVFSIASSVTALHLGRVITTGTPDEVRCNPEVQAAYLGPTDHALGPLELA
jgi:branched-chain amino acid transport system ATP-binding protein